MFQVVESSDKGKIVIAAKDFTPGEVIVREEATLFMRKDEYLSSQYTKLQQSTGIENNAWCLYDAFLRLPEEKRELVLNLHGPLSYPKCVRARELLGEHNHPIPDEKMEEFLKLFAISALNAFGGVSGKDLEIYTGASTRVSHSCQPNCINIMDDHVLHMISKVPIKCGEELTITYNGNYDSKPIHERRMRSKNFLCMCPRCTAPGDDNRQFNCSDAKCRGHMLACQPTSEDVPYLLPCSVCKRAASEAFTAEMFAIEKQLPIICDGLKEGFAKVFELKLFGPVNFRKLMGHLIPPYIPPNHRQSLFVIDAKCAFLIDSGDKSLIAKAIADIIVPMESFLDIPSSDLSLAYQFIGVKCLYLDDYHKAKEFMQKSLRMSMMIFGRDKRSAHIDQLLNTLLSHLPLDEYEAVDVCTYCGETPEEVAITLSRCGRCQKVVYCGKGCQKAHWDPLHKRTCVKVRKAKEVLVFNRLFDIH